MSIVNKLLRIAGRGVDGNAKPLEIDENGNLRVVFPSGNIEGGTSSGGSNGIMATDINTNELKPLTAFPDDQGNFVLRTVDAAPYIVEISRFQSATHYTVAVTATSIDAIAANINRKYLLIANESSNTVYISLGSPAEMSKGIPLKTGEKLEFSSMKGNLYTGAIYGIATSSSPILVTEGV